MMQSWAIPQHQCVFPGGQPWPMACCLVVARHLLAQSAIVWQRELPNCTVGLFEPLGWTWQGFMGGGGGGGGGGGILPLLNQHKKGGFKANCTTVAAKRYASVQKHLEFFQRCILAGRWVASDDPLALSVLCLPN